MSDPVREAYLLPLSVRPLSATTRRRARLTVCRNAADTAEARELLLMLGLVKEKKPR